jgi:hypothetical protein
MHNRTPARTIDLLVTTTACVLGLLACASAAHAQQATPLFATSAVQDTPQIRAVEHSDAYYTRLTIHRLGSYAILPLFGAQYLLGRELLNGGAAEWVKPTHRIVAYSIGGVFTVNTVTGVWNLIEGRHDTENRTRRFIHAALMLGADAGFVYTGIVSSKDAAPLSDSGRRHRDAALISVSAATAATLIMWLSQ